MVRSRCIIALVALAVAIRAMVPAGFMLSPASGGDGVMTVVVCTSSGLKLMHLDPDGKPVAPPGHAVAEAPCSYGPPTVAVAVFEPGHVEIERRTEQISHHQLVAFASADHHRSFRRARGPPAPREFQ